MAYDAEFPKDPDAVVDFTRDWSAWLGTDEIVNSTWIAEAGITIDSSSNTLTTATVWLSGGTPFGAYIVTNRIATLGGRLDDRSFLITVGER